MAEKKKLTIWALLGGLVKFIIGLLLIVQSLIFVTILVMIISVMTAASDKMAAIESGPTVTKMKPNTALILNPRGVLVEKAVQNDRFEAAMVSLYGGQMPSQVSVHDIVHVIRTAKKDKNVEMMVINLNGLRISPSSMSKVFYITQELEDFKKSGKKVIAVTNYLTDETYAIYAMADEIILHDEGGTGFTGFGSYGLYTKDLWDKLKVKNHVFRHGKYKSALEDMIETEMSEAAKEQSSAYWGAIWDQTVDHVSSQRELTGDFQYIVENYGDILAENGSYAEAALNVGLVDTLMDNVAFVEMMQNAVGGEKAGYDGITMNNYMALNPRLYEDNPGKDDIVVITGQGPIVGGSGANGVISAGYMIGRLREARFDDNVKAVVLRLDTPGGSSFASELIRDEILALKAEGKPVVVSMGSVVASGGYWISADADKILIEPHALTGSIGIYSMSRTFEDAAEFLGARVDGVGTTNMAATNMMGPGAMPEAHRKLRQAGIDSGYDKFLSIVANGRGMTKDEAHEVAQGRVWVAADALEHNLADEYGYIDDAIKAAAEMAELEKYDVLHGADKTNPFGRVTRTLGNSSVHYVNKDQEPTLLSQMDFGLFDNSPYTENEMDLSSGSFYLKQPSAMVQLIDTMRGQVEMENILNDPNSTYVLCVECLR